MPKCIGKLAFNYPVNIADLRSNLSLKLQDNVILPYTLQPESGIAKEISIETEEIPRLLGNQSLKVQIDKGFNCIGGKIGLKQASIRNINLGWQG